MLARRLENGQVVLEQVVVMEVDVVEAIRFDHAQDEWARGMGGKSNVPDTPLLAPSLGNRQASAGCQRPIHRILVIHTMDGQEIQVVDL